MDFHPSSPNPSVSADIHLTNLDQVGNCVGEPLRMLNMTVSEIGFAAKTDFLSAYLDVRMEYKVQDFPIPVEFKLPKLELRSSKSVSVEKSACDSIKAETKCNSDKKCTWCKCAAVPSACFSL